MYKSPFGTYSAMKTAGNVTVEQNSKDGFVKITKAQFSPEDGTRVDDTVSQYDLKGLNNEISTLERDIERLTKYISDMESQKTSIQALISDTEAILA